MHISPISFGRTVKVNAPYHVAQQAANLVNDYNVSPEEKKVQKQLKTLFFDRTKDGEARVYSTSPNTSYIFSGEESEHANALRFEMEEAIEAGREYYGADNPLADITFECESDRYEDLMKLLISETHDGTELDIDYDETKGQIKSINLMI